MTPKLLRKLLEASSYSSLVDTAPAVAADLVIGAFFFAMRSRQCPKPSTPGQTKFTHLDGLTFRSTSNTLTNHKHADPLSKAQHVTVTFGLQQNGTQMHYQA